jgi:hypothetical protein
MSEVVQVLEDFVLESSDSTEAQQGAEAGCLSCS